MTDNIMFMEQSEDRINRTADKRIAAVCCPVVARREAVLRHFLVHDKGPHRNAAAESLRAGDNVRRDAELLECPHRSGPSHAALDLIEDKKDVPLSADLLNASDEIRICRIDAAFSLNGLHNNRARFVRHA